LIDTAGLGEYRDEIEKEALNRTRRAIEECDLVLFVVDGSRPLTPEDNALIGQIRSKKSIAVINKSDRPSKVDVQELCRFFAKEATVDVSALEGKNIIALEALIFKTVFQDSCVLSEGFLVSNTRHVDILKRVAHCLAMSMDSMRKNLSLEFAALDLKKALDTLGELTGEVFSEDLLDVIFSKFCIGK